MAKDETITTAPLFEPAPELHKFEPLTKRPKKGQAPSERLWTEKKAVLIQRYLYYFVLVTHNGTYIDGFAGPQDPAHEDRWAAKLVLESEPAWLRRFSLYDADADQVTRLERLAVAHRTKSRRIDVTRGDFNIEVRELLASGALRPKGAAFCLLDQRTFECHWATLEAIAGHPREEFKIEIFYFLANYWLGRAIAASTSGEGQAAVRAWWGRDDWVALRALRGPRRADLVAARFRDELGYRSARPYAIYDREHNERVMYYMVHATDHPAAAGLMERAYRYAVVPDPLNLEQLALELDLKTREG